MRRSAFPGRLLQTLAGRDAAPMPEDLHRLHRLTLNRPGEPLFAALAECIPGLSRAQARRAVMAGLARLDGVRIDEAKHPLPESAELTLDLRHGIDKAYQARMHDAPAIADTRLPFTILHEDSQVLVVDKSAGILSAPTRGTGLGHASERGHLPELVRRALNKRGREVHYLGVVHRLDQDTSGCLVLALTRDAHAMLSKQFAGHAAGRTYRCLVAGTLHQDRGTLHGTISRGQDGRRQLDLDGETPGEEAITHYRVVRRFANAAELEVELGTGRTHQIRVSLTAIHCPVFGDRVYGPRPGSAPIGPRAPRLMLHAWKLGFDHPRDGKRMELIAPLPPEFTEFAGVLDRA